MQWEYQYHDSTLKVSWLEPLQIALCKVILFTVKSFFLPKNDANKVDLSRIKFRNILEGDGLILANEVSSVNGEVDGDKKVQG